MLSGWWMGLEPAMKILWVVTLSASLIFLIQTILTFIGVGGDTDLDLDADTPDGSGMGLLTFRNFVNFCLGFGWTAILLRDKISSTGLLLIISMIVGFVLVFLVMMIYKWLGSMQESGNIDITKLAVGCEGEVYLTIPASRGGVGKVQININGSVREYAAMTDGEMLANGRRIRVVEVFGNTLLVEPVESIII
ncbi:MAG: NfeD family protein [Bacteroidales bacterium]|nr:NfeD family protein [Bacteroidales bacterium]MDY3783557.1 NfeD family protein [Candidatus Cryptobacteroides sp.]